MYTGVVLVYLRLYHVLRRQIGFNLLGHIRRPIQDHRDEIVLSGATKLRGILRSVQGRGA